MELFVFVFSTIVFLYLLTIILLIAGFYKIPEEMYKTEFPVNDFSVIIPFRNEEDNLETLIESLNKIEYPHDKFEIIFVNDNSDDSSLEIATSLLKFIDFKHSVLSLTEGLSGKKAALTFGIENATNPWIITTDADCVVRPLWLKLYDQKLEEDDLKMLAGPINFITKERGFIDAFQKLDLSALTGTTIGGFGLGKPLMCSGANLLFSKEVFFEVSGYDGNMDIASGDDIFLMEKFIEKYPGEISYLKAHSAIVYTYSMTSAKDFINQRLRWAAKSANYSSKNLKYTSILVGASNISFIILLILAIFGVSLNNILPILGLKILVNFWIIKISSNFLRDIKKLYFYPLISVIYPFYIVYIAISSQFISFDWKGRKLEK